MRGSRKLFFFFTHWFEEAVPKVSTEIRRLLCQVLLSEDIQSPSELDAAHTPESNKPTALHCG